MAFCAQVKIPGPAGEREENKKAGSDPALLKYRV
jgi:hypothetical protein